MMCKLKLGFVCCCSSSLIGFFFIIGLISVVVFILRWLRSFHRLAGSRCGDKFAES